MNLLDQLLGLVLGSAPTAILFLLLVFLYSVLVRKPLEKTLAERRKRTSGAVDQARNAMAMAETETAVYEEKLRAARQEIAAARESRMRQWQSEREAAIAAARASSQEMVRTARIEIEQSAASARKQIEAATDELSEQILRTLLPGGAAPLEARK